MFYFVLGPHFTLITHDSFSVFLLFHLLLVVLLDFSAVLRLVCSSMTDSPEGLGKERVCPVNVKRSTDAATVQTPELMTAIHFCLLCLSCRSSVHQSACRGKLDGFCVHIQEAPAVLAHSDT